MPPIDSYSPNKTSISFSWPPEVTGLERIMLSAQGDLQRVLSAFFASPISISLVYSHTFLQKSPDLPPNPLALPNSTITSTASPETPIIQTRQVHLQCKQKIVCTATSTVRVTSPRCAHLFFEEKYAIGQMFRQMQTPPQFELVEVGFGNDQGASAWNDQLWRKYKLTMPGFECDILEVFPSRKMFLSGQGWLTEETPVEVAKTYFKKDVVGATHFLGFPFSLPAGSDILYRSTMIRDTAIAFRR